MRGNTLIRSSTHVLLWAGPLATLAGIVAYRFWNMFPLLVDAATVAIAITVFTIGWPLRHWLRWQPATSLAAVWLVLLVAFAGPVPVLATVTMCLAAIGLGEWALPATIASPWARISIAAIAGMALMAGAVGWLLPLPVHPWLEVSLVAVAIVLLRGSIRACLAPLPAAWRDAVAASPMAATFAVLALGLTTTVCWMPTLQYDDLAYHLALPSQLQQLGYYRMDVESNVWAVAPWAADTLQAIVQSIAHAESRGPLDALWAVLSAVILWQLGGEFALKPAFRWLLVALYATLPTVAALAGGMQTEGPATAVMLALALVVSRASAAADSPVLESSVLDGRVLRCAGVLAGLLCGLKIIHAVALPPMGLWLLWRWRGRVPWRALPAALALGTLIAGSSYAYALWVTGNPVFPLFNDHFKSPFFPAIAFKDMRWLAGMHVDLPWQITFATSLFGEDRPGTAGFIWIALAGALLIALAKPATRALAACGLFVVLVPLSQLQYLRYAEPGIVLLLPALVTAVAETAPRRAAITLLVGLCLLDFMVQPNANWILHSGGVARRVFYGRTIVADPFAPERRLAPLLAERPAAEHALFVGSAFVAEEGGRAYTSQWYDPTLQAATAAADRDTSGRAWRSLFTRAGIRWVETERSPTSPALVAALSDARPTAAFGNTQLWQLPITVGAAVDLSALRDHSLHFVAYWPFIVPRREASVRGPYRLAP